MQTPEGLALGRFSSGYWPSGVVVLGWPVADVLRLRRLCLPVFWPDCWSLGAVEGLVGDIVGGLGVGTVPPLD